MTTTTTKKILIIAGACHALNNALCEAIGDLPILSWDETSEAVRSSTIAGVQYHLDNPTVTPEQSHEAWRKYRAEQGWVHGFVKDVEAKVHPNMVPYAELETFQKAKDHVFRACVHALKDLPLEAVEPVAAAMAVAAVPAGPLVVPRGFAPVTYIGKRESYKDGLFGTGLTFVRGQTLPVPIAAAVKMFGHPDVYVPGKIEDAPPADTVPEALDPAVAQAEKDKQEDQAQDQRDAVSRMTSKAAVADYAKTHFNQDLDRRLSLADLKAKTIQLLDQFGAA